jgi:hypothetical protein
MTAGISASVGLVCLVAAFLIWTVGGKHTPRLVVLLVIAGTVGILGSPVGGWLRTAVGYLDSLAATATGRLTGTVVVGLVGLISLYVLIVHMKNKAISVRTLAAAVITPVAITSVPGVVGSVGASVVHAIASGVGMAFGAAFGIH